MYAQTAWGGLLPVYLFLGGLGGASLAIVGLFALAGVKKTKRLATIVSACSLACLAAGACILLFDTSIPERSIILWESFVNFDSWLTRGAWLLVAAMVLAGVFVIVNAVASSNSSMRRICGFFSIVVGFFTAGYTGVLLMSATAIPAWGSPIVPALFVFSSFVSASAFIAVAMQILGEKKSRGLCLFELLNEIGETFALGCYLVWLSYESAETHLSADMLLCGDLGLVFWVGIVVLGLIVPLVLSSLLLYSKKHRALSNVLTWASALSVCVGNLCLRFAVMGIGIHTVVVIL